MKKMNIAKTGENIGSKSRKRNRRLSSILKGGVSPSREALGDLDPNYGSEPEIQPVVEKKSRRSSRRVSFAEFNQVKEFVKDISWNPNAQTPGDKDSSCNPRSVAKEPCDITGLQSLLTGDIQDDCTPGNIEPHLTQDQTPCHNGEEPSVPMEMTILNSTEMDMTTCQGNISVHEKKTEDIVFHNRQNVTSNSMPSLYIPKRQFSPEKQSEVYEVGNKTDFVTVMHTSINKYSMAPTDITSTTTTTTKNCAMAPTTTLSKSFNPNQSTLYGDGLEGMDMTACYTGKISMMDKRKSANISQTYRSTSFMANATANYHGNDETRVFGDEGLEFTQPLSGVIQRGNAQMKSVDRGKIHEPVNAVSSTSSATLANVSAPKDGIVSSSEGLVANNDLEDDGMEFTQTYNKTIVASNETGVHGQTQQGEDGGMEFTQTYDKTIACSIPQPIRRQGLTNDYTQCHGNNDMEFTQAITGKISMDFTNNSIPNVRNTGLEKMDKTKIFNQEDTGEMEFTKPYTGNISMNPISAAVKKTDSEQFEKVDVKSFLSKFRSTQKANSEEKGKVDSQSFISNFKSTKSANQEKKFDAKSFISKFQSMKNKSLDTTKVMEDDAMEFTQAYNKTSLASGVAQSLTNDRVNKTVLEDDAMEFTQAFNKTIVSGGLSQPLTSNECMNKTKVLDDDAMEFTQAYNKTIVSKSFSQPAHAGSHKKADENPHLGEDSMEFTQTLTGKVTSNMQVTGFSCMDQTKIFSNEDTNEMEFTKVCTTNFSVHGKLPPERDLDKEKKVDSKSFVSNFLKRYSTNSILSESKTHEKENQEFVLNPVLDEGDTTRTDNVLKQFGSTPKVESDLNKSNVTFTLKDVLQDVAMEDPQQNTTLGNRQNLQQTFENHQIPDEKKDTSKIHEPEVVSAVGSQNASPLSEVSQDIEREDGRNKTIGQTEPTLEQHRENTVSKSMVYETTLLDIEKTRHGSGQSQNSTMGILEEGTIDLVGSSFDFGPGIESEAQPSMMASKADLQHESTHIQNSTQAQDSTHISMNSTKTNQYSSDGSSMEMGSNSTLTSSRRDRSCSMGEKSHLGSSVLYQSGIGCTADTELNSVQDYLKIFGVARNSKSIIHNSRRSTMALTAFAKIPKTESEIMESKYCIEPEVYVYEWACNWMTTKINQLDKICDQLENQATAAKPQLFVDIDEAEDKNAFIKQVKQNQLKVLKKLAKKNFKEFRAKMVKSICSSIESSESTLREMLTKSRTEAERFAEIKSQNEEEMKKLQEQIEEDAEKLNQLEQLDEEILKLQSEINDQDKELEELTSIQSQVQNDLEVKEKAANMAETLLQEKQTMIQDTKDITELWARLENVESVLEWEFLGCSDSIYKFSFLYGSLRLIIEYESNDSLSNKIKGISLESNLDEKEAASYALLAHRLIIGSFSAPELMGKYPSANHITTLLDDISLKVIKGRGLAEDVAKIEFFHNIAVTDNSLAVTFVSMPAHVKFDLILSMDLETYSDHPLAWTHKTTIGAISVKEIEKVVQDTEPGNVYKLIENMEEMLNRKDCTSPNGTRLNMKIKQLCQDMFIN